MQPLFYLMLSSGLNMCYYATWLSQVTEKTLDPEDSNQKVNEMTSFVLLVLGFGELLGGFLIGKLMDSRDKTVLMNSNSAII